MGSRRTRTDGAAGQTLVLFALGVTVLVMLVALVVDGGNGLAQRRDAQNDADFAALAGARIVAHFVAGDLSNGTDANVRQAIVNSVSATGGTVTFGSPTGPRYVDTAGATKGYVGAFGSAPPPAGTVGVVVPASRTFRTYFLGIIQVPSLTASATATARGGYAAGAPGGGVFPVGIAEAFFLVPGRMPCGGEVSTDPGSPCYPQHMTPGTLNVPGGFGWLKLGAAGKCTGFGLGMTNDGCDENKPFLQSEIGPPPNSHGCCTAPSGDPAKDRIGSLPGNKASADCDWYIDNKVIITVPVWDYAGGTGANGWYHIIGFTGFQLTACNGGKDIEGVWRQPFYVGPTTSVPGFAGAPLAVQLIK
jgi:Flp pilus assembly protein TadG